MSAIDTNTITIDRNKTTPPSAKTAFVETKEVLKPLRFVASKSLQEALYTKRPDFVQKSQLRVEYLHDIKKQRLIYAEKYKNWIDYIAQVTPDAMTSYPAMLPPPEMPKIPRLFNHKEMITQAKAKYQKLPEVIYHKSEAKRKTSYRTNRMKAKIYKKNLQKKVLQGRVTLTHHNHIL